MSGRKRHAVGAVGSRGERSLVRDPDQALVASAHVHGFLTINKHVRRTGNADLAARENARCSFYVAL